MTKTYKNYKYVLPTLIIISIIMQLNFFVTHGNTDDPMFFFLFVSFPDHNYFGNPFVLIQLFAPIIFFLFWTSGDFNQLITGCGKLRLIRGVSRIRLLITTIAKTMIKALVFILIHTLFYLAFCRDFTSVPLNVFLRSMISYIMGISTLLLLQVFLELYFQPMKADMGIFLFCTFSCLMASNEKLPTFVKAIAFPYLLFGCSNGSFGNVSSWLFWLIWLIILAGFFLFLSLRRFKKTDIF